MQKTIDKINRNLMKHKVITMLERNEVEFLDKLGKDSLFSTGHKLSYNEILKALIDFAMEAKVSGENIPSFDVLKQKLKEKIA
ncbi:MAG: hypothetical protein PHN59_03760 [Candidatus Omnitrophica bacterium]|nr:hypothetical protein [Candidatus Omnitrophota bacterium]